MSAVCPKCACNALEIVTGDGGKPISKCLKCGTETVVAETFETDRLAPRASRAFGMVLTTGHGWG
jgi:uncharacterized Zn finger protein